MADGDRAGLVSVAGALAVLVSLFSFLPIVQGGRWWFEGLVFVVAASATSALARRIGLPTAAGALVALTSIPLVCVALTGGGLLLVLPTDDAAQRVLGLLTEANAQIYRDTVPAGDTTALSLLMGVGAGAAAVVVDAVAVGLRAPIAGMLVVLALTLVPGKALATGTSGVLLVAVAASILLVVAADRRRRGRAPRLPGLAAGGAVALVVALLAQVVLPAPVATQAQAGVPSLFGSGVDPLIRLGESLRRGADVPVVRYTSDKGAETYLRLGVLEVFSGDTWAPNAADGGLLGVTAAPSAPGLAPADVRGTTTTRIDPQGLSSIGERLPLPYPATRVTGVSSAFRWEERGLTLVRATTDPLGAYTVDSADVETTAAELRRASVSAPAGDVESTRLPDDVPSIIRTTEQAWTKNADTPYAAALAIQNRLRNGVFSYDENTPAQQGYDGDGLGVIATFLAVKAGYCVHYASTMAVMARLQGIPSRVVVGYQPGDAESGTKSRLVTSDDLHAWPELYFDGVGWVRFEPTPGRGAAPSYAPQPNVSASSTPRAAVDQSRAPSVQPTDAATAGGGGAGADLARFGAAALRVAGPSALIVLLLLIPGTVRRFVRRRRLGRLGTEGAVGAWREVTDSIADLGLPTGRGRSPREAEEVIAAGLEPTPGVRAALTRIRVGYERQTYGSRQAAASADDVEAVLRAAGARAGRSRRLLAAVAPRSLPGTLGRSRLAFGWSPPGSG